MRFALALIAALACASAGAQPRNMNVGGQGGHLNVPLSQIAARYLPTISTADECACAAIPGVTVSRSSSATCTKSDGTLVTCDADEPRVDADGLVWEPDGTNLLLRTEEFSAASWAKQTGVTVTADSATCGNAPNGAQTADLVDLTSATTLQGIFQATTTSGGSAAHSIWVWRPSGDAACDVNMVDPGAALGTLVISTTTAPVRAVLVEDNGNTTKGIWLRKPGSSACSRICVWGAQLEMGSRATSYIKSLGTQGTRDGDLISVAQPASMTDTAGCVAATVKADAISGTPRIFGFGATNRLAYTATTTVALHDGTNTASGTLASSGVGRSVRVVGTWQGSTLTAAESGQTAGTGTYDGALLSDPIYLMSDSSGANGLSGHIKAIVFGKNAGACQ